MSKQSEVGEALKLVLRKEPLLKEAFLELINLRIETAKQKAFSKLLERDEYVRLLGAVDEMKWLRTWAIGEELEDARRREYDRRTAAK